jgi:hypothetical protein
MIPLWKDDFDAWLRAPVPRPAQEHPRLRARRAQPSEFERIYDLVDEAFGVRRPRALYDWLYRENPGGPARSWILVDRETDRVVSATVRWPWPLARGTEPVAGMLQGDLAVAPDWQRQRIGDLRYAARSSHPWTASEATFGWPNEKSVRRKMRKPRGAESLLGPLPKITLPVRLSLARRIAMRWQRRSTAGALRVEPVRRFDASFDVVTREGLQQERYWSPHHTDFLNWRYFDHPQLAYRALALVAGDEPRAYAVLCERGRSARLMEFTAPDDDAIAQPLIGAVLDAARQGGARRLVFHATPRWRHWHRLEAMAARPASPGPVLHVERRVDPEVNRIEHWQLLPGDCDTL